MATLQIREIEDDIPNNTIWRRRIQPSNHSNTVLFDKQKNTNLNFKQAKFYANYYDRSEVHSKFTLIDWPPRNTPRDEWYEWQGKLRHQLDLTRELHPDISNTRAKFRYHDYYLWSKLCEISKDRNNCNGWTDVTRYYRPLRKEHTNDDNIKKGASRYQDLLKDADIYGEEVFCCCGKGNLQNAFYTEAVNHPHRQSLEGSTCIFKMWFTPVLHHCIEYKFGFSNDEINLAYEDIHKLKNSGLKWIEKFENKLNLYLRVDVDECNQPMIEERKWLLRRCAEATQYIEYAKKRKNKKKKDGNELRKDIEEEMKKNVCIDNFQQLKNDILECGIISPAEKEKLEEDLYDICFKKELEVIENLVPAKYLIHPFTDESQVELNKINTENVLENYYESRADIYEKTFRENELVNLIDTLNKFLHKIEEGVNPCNLKKYKQDQRKKEKEEKKIRKAKKKQDKMDKWKQIKSYYELHLDPKTYPVAGWKLTKYGKKLCKLWKRQRGWLRQYVEDEQWFIGDKYELIKYRWVVRANHLTNILDDAQNSIWDDQYVDEIFCQCDWDDYYR
jgi:hypothetical protein